MRQRMEWIGHRPLAVRQTALARRLWVDLKALGALLLLWQARARERHRLANMGEHMRRDIGLTEADILREVNKPFWRQ